MADCSHRVIDLPGAGPRYCGPQTEETTCRWAKTRPSTPPSSPARAPPSQAEGEPTHTHTSQPAAPSRGKVPELSGKTSQLHGLRSLSQHEFKCSLGHVVMGGPGSLGENFP